MLFEKHVGYLVYLSFILPEMSQRSPTPKNPGQYGSNKFLKSFYINNLVKWISTNANDINDLWVAGGTWVGVIWRSCYSWAF